MSWQALAWAMKQKAGSPGGKLLLLALANHANAQGRAWPSQGTLADCTELSVDSIQRHARTLQAAGLLSMSPQPRAKGQWPGFEYRLNMPAEAQPEVRSPTPTGPHPAARSPGRTERHGPGRKCPPDRAANCGTNLKENHSKKDFQSNEAKEAKEAKQPAGEQVVFPTYSEEWLSWVKYHQATGNHRRAEVMLSQAEKGRWHEWAEPTRWPPPYPVDGKEAVSR